MLRGGDVGLETWNPPRAPVRRKKQEKVTQYRLITVAGGYGRELTPRWASVASVKVAPRAACTIIAWRQLSLSWGPTVLRQSRDGPLTKVQRRDV